MDDEQTGTNPQALVNALTGRVLFRAVPGIESRMTDILIGTSAFTAACIMNFRRPKTPAMAVAKGRIRTAIKFALNVESRCDTKSGSKTKSGLFGTR